MRFVNAISRLLGGLLCLAPAAARAGPPPAPATSTTALETGRDQAALPDPEDAPSEGFYVDPARGPIRFQPEYERWFGDERRPPHYGRTALELAGILAI